MKGTRTCILILTFIFLGFSAQAQHSGIKGKITSSGKPIPSATVSLDNHKGTLSDTAGSFLLPNLPAGTYQIRVSSVGFNPVSRNINLKENEELVLHFELDSIPTNLEEVVVTGTLKEMRKLESPVPVEVYQPSFFRKNPTPNIFDALQNVNGVRPQLNCNVCNTGDIHINGLEGPYTMVLIDGMPIVSSLSTVYGLSGIPNALVERVEIVKGPASSLYGSEAVGGLINIITKKPQNAPLISADVFATSWQELNTDIGWKLAVGSKATVFTGLNYFRYNKPFDKNGDQFTDVTLQNRVSLFQKWNLTRKNNRLFTMGARYFYEDRWGGDTRWNRSFRGSDSIYGESIYTKRWELIGQYQLPTREKLLLSFSYNFHDQNSYYGTTPYLALQKIAFSQLTWDKKRGAHDLLAGAALRYTYYDDNTPATTHISGQKNQPSQTWLPGLFVQDELALHAKHKLLLGLRYDYHSEHGNIYTPRLAYKWTPDTKNIFRLNAGTGFRVVNLFTEEHAALTGARTVLVQEDLKPERSMNINLNYIKKMFSGNGSSVTLDASAWYTYFNNRIIPDYDTDPNSIIYKNLQGHAVTRGISLNVDAVLHNGLKVLAGGTFMDVFTKEDNSLSNEKIRPVLTERWTGTWALSYKISPLNLLLDYTGNVYGPMRLPLLGPLDPRKEYSPVWSIQNIQATWSKPASKWEVYGGVKNLLNWTPAKNNPFLIARSHDPFDKEVTYDAEGKVVRTDNNPYALTFDPTYVYAPNQGIRFFAGIRIMVK